MLMYIMIYGIGFVMIFFVLLMCRLCAAMSASKIQRFLNILLVVLLTGITVGCASSNKNTYAQKRKQASKVNTSQLGRNKYYFSSGYQKKLVSSYKKKR